MSMARLVITALYVERQSPAEVATRYGAHRSWEYPLAAPYGAACPAGLVTRRSPATAPPQPRLRGLGSTKNNPRPNPPTPCARVDRFQKTMKTWLPPQPHSPATIPALRALLDTFVETYTQQRPHRSLPHRATPATAYT